jgi:hypothetical protein
MQAYIFQIIPMLNILLSEIYIFRKKSILILVMRILRQ